MYFKGLFKKLNHGKIKYLVIGGVAVNLHGYPRMTGDLDILIEMDTKNIKKFVDMVKRLGWKPKVPVQVEAFADAEKRKDWIEEKGMKVFSVYNPKDVFEHIDVMVENYIDFGKAYLKRKIVSVGGVRVPVVSMPDLIRLKKIAGRPRDLTDIRTLLQIQELENAEKKRRSR